MNFAVIFSTTRESYLYEIIGILVPSICESFLQEMLLTILPIYKSFLLYVYTVAMNSKRVYAGITPPERLSCINGVDTAILRGGEDNGRGAGVRSNAVDCVEVFVVADGLTAVRRKNTI